MARPKKLPTAIPFPLEGTSGTETYDGTDIGGWSSGATAYDNNVGNFLGRFGNNELTRTFDIDNASLDIDFDFHRLDSWDGEQFYAKIGNQTLFSHGPSAAANYSSGWSGVVNGVSYSITRMQILEIGRLGSGRNKPSTYQSTCRRGVRPSNFRWEAP